MKQIVFIAVVLLCFNGPSSAQPTPPALQKKITGKKNLNAIMAEVETYFKKEADGQDKLQKSIPGLPVKEAFESALLHWKRWEYFNQTRLKPNGDLEDVYAKTVKAWEKVTAKYGDGHSINSPNAPQSGSNPAWNFIGPFNLQYQGGFFRGTSKTDRIVFHPTDPNTFYVCSVNGGLWRTQNGGSTWTTLNFYFPIQSAAGLAINPSNPNNLFVITGDPKGGNGIQQNSCGIWVTYDGGGNWFKTSFDSDAQTTAFTGYKIVMMPTLTNVLFAATRSGLYRSTNSGNTWTLVISGVIYDVEFDPSQYGRVYASGANRFYLSEDYGATFPASQQTSIAGANRIEIGVSPANSNYVYLLCGPYGGGGAVGSNTFRGIFRSGTGGTAGSFVMRTNTPNILCDATNGIVTTVNEGDQSGYDLAIDVHKTDAERIMVGGKIIWTSNNGGLTGSLTNVTPYVEPNTNAIPPANYIHPDIQDIAYNPLNNLLYACTDGGVYVTGNGGAVWTNITNGIHATTFFHMAAAPFDVNRVLGGTQDNGVKYKTNTGDFTHIAGADGFDCAFGPSAASSIYTTINSTVAKFDINGTAQAVTTPPNTAFFPVIAADPVTNNTIYLAAGPPGILKSINGGTSWTSTPLTQNIRQSIITCPNNANRVYVVGTGSIFRTDNGGTNWTGNLAANPGFINNGQISDINVSSGNSDYVYVTLGGYAAGQKVMYSNNAGANWFSISGTLPAEVKVNCVAVDNGNNAYIGTDMGVYYQAVSSSDWTPYFNQLPRVPVTDLVINQGALRIRASTYGHGIWETGLFTPCDINFSLTGAIAGEQFYQASGTLSSTASIVGGNLTNVTARAGTELYLGPNFTVFEGNVFNGILGPCNSSPVFPITGGRSSDLPPAFINQADKGNDTTLYPYGFITISQQANAPASVTINAIRPGDFMVVVSDKTGNEELLRITQNFAAEGFIEKPLPTSSFLKGKYFVQLYFNGRLVHVQELILL